MDILLKYFVNHNHNFTIVTIQRKKSLFNEKIDLAMLKSFAVYYFSDNNRIIGFHSGFSLVEDLNLYILEEGRTAGVTLVRSQLQAQPFRTFSSQLPV